MFSKKLWYFASLLLILAHSEFAYAKTCSKSKPCGNTCIALSYTCHIGGSSGSSSSSSSTTTPIVNNTNLTPIASFSYFINESAQLILFDASSSLDSDGSIQSYDWSLSNGQTFSGKTANAIDGQSASGATAQFTFTANGTYDINLLVTDNQGDIAQKTYQVVIQKPVVVTPPRKHNNNS